MWLARVAWCGLMAMAVRAGAQEQSTNDINHQLSRYGVAANAERIVHHGRRYLLVWLRSGAPRMRPVARGNGITEFVEIRDGGPAFLPVLIHCSGMRMEVDGGSVAPDSLSHCRESAQFNAPMALPAFVVFPLPRPGFVRVTIPVTVLESPSPDAPAAMPGGASRGEARPTGSNTIAVGVLVQEPKPPASRP